MASEAFYYPYTTIQTIESIKSGILYFDKIHILRPNEIKLQKDSDEVERLLYLLEDEKIIKFISPSEIMSDYDDILTQNIMTDMSDKQFNQLSGNKKLDDWTIYSEKIPSYLADSVVRKYFVNIPYFDDVHSLANKSYSEVYSRSHLYHEIDEMNRYRNRQYNEYRIVKMKFHIGESLMINHALCSCDKYNLTPFTDEILHYNYLKYKMDKIKNQKIFKNILFDYK